MSSRNPSNELIKRLAEEIRASGQQGLIPTEDAESIANSLKGQSDDIKVQLVVPAHVLANIRTSLANLSYARCARCGHVYNLNSRPALLNNPRCDCDGPLVPAPIWSITAKGLPPSNRRLTTSQGIKLVLSIEEYSRARQRLQGTNTPSKIHIRDKSRPIATLEFKYGPQSHDPIPIHRSGVFRYWLSLMPSESITKPVTITSFAYSEEDCIEIDPTAGPLRGISKILYCSNLEVLQATLLYRAGHQRTSSSTRVSVIDIHSSPLSGTFIRIPTRYIWTHGLVIRIDENTIKRALRDAGYKNDNIWTALHTVSHAFLVRLPQITGLEGMDFGEALSTHMKEVAIYDNSMGGLGGVEGVVNLEEQTLTPNYEWSVRDSYNCPLACTRACKACLYTDSCFMLNWRLDRRILERLGW